MTPERWVQIEELFHRAVECEGQHRTALLDQACSDDPELRRQVEALLSSDGSASLHVRAAVRTELDAVGFPLTGQTISHYRVLEGLGGGGMGLVYTAEDIRLGRRVALKFLPEDSAKDPTSLARFEREARSASALEHPNICPIYEFGEHEGRPFLAMQLLEGQTLRELIATGGSEKPPLELATLLDLAIQILDGLEAAHGLGIIHRDIKPANIFVTRQGQAKILDFGLAKLARDAGIADDDMISDHRAQKRAPRPVGTSRETAPVTPDPFLSRTGTLIGTAGYMSPEQVNGEELDARTDLFSFGLVLYEMATGQRAFSGDTGPLLHAAILKQTPAPVRIANPRLPAKLEEIINRALQKDRNARYPSASALRDDLEALRRRVQPKRISVRLWAPAAGIFILLGLTVAFLLTKPPAMAPAGDLKLRQLTVNSVENPVRNGAISPDGKYLAYGDRKKLYLKLIATGETQPITLPESLAAKFNWEIGPWFRDSTRFLANAHPQGIDPGDWSSGGEGIWIVSVLGGTPRKLRDDAVAYSISPDGSQIGFGTHKGKFGSRELWLMGPNGEQPRMLYSTGEDSALAGLFWSQDQKRILYGLVDDSGLTVISRDLLGGPPTTVEPLVKVTNVGDVQWLPDGRLIYSMEDQQSISNACNFWVMRLDRRTALPTEKPRRITNWSDHCMSGTSVTADGKQFAFMRWAGRFTTYVADFKSGGASISAPRHLTLTESYDVPDDWTPDSQTLIFSSNRNGHLGIYKQSLNSDAAEPIVTAPDGVWNPRVGPDGASILYLASTKASDPSAPFAVMRVPISGGKSQPVLTAQPNSTMYCARGASNSCAIAEPTRDNKQVIITAFHPFQGRGSELARLDLDPATNFWIWNLSPDGTRIAALTDHAGPIHVLSSRGLPREEIKVNGWSSLQSVNWDADGRGFLVGNTVQGGAVLLHVDRKGNARVLWENPGGTSVPGLPSPDGRHLAIQVWNVDCNIWMMENF